MHEKALVEAFEAERGRLVAVAHRMLGSRQDAEDAVQEAWLRLARQDATEIDNLAAWLNTVVGRVCVDVLRSRRTRPEDPLDDMVVIEEDSSPAEDALLADSVGLALLVVLDTLTPAERLAFVLHDTFAVPFAEIAQILGKSVAATKMLASRARQKVQGRHPDDQARKRAVVTAFLAAARNGDFEELVRLLDPDVTWRSRGPRGETVRLGATEVATRVQRGARAAATAHPALVNGSPGVVVRRLDGSLMGVMACTVVDDRIVAIESVSDPDLLTGMGLR
ncbi:sigma-70 family RNA polymerase sigma factor [Kibdelosporangium lantanae]